MSDAAKGVTDAVISGRRVLLRRGVRDDSPLVVLNTFGDEGKRVLDTLLQMTDADFSLAAVSDIDWNREMSPWPYDDGRNAFAGGADAFLEELTGEIIPQAERLMSVHPSRRFIAGYSLAGLFAIYSLYRTDLFSGAVSASGSLWYPGFAEFAEKNDPVRMPDRIYLSLGDRESKTRNPVMAAVGQRTEELCGLYASKGIGTVFESNPGNHFREPELRTAKGIAWILG